MNRVHVTFFKVFPTADEKSKSHRNNQIKADVKCIFRAQLCFNASLTVKMYAILPGKQIFISNYHPIKNIDSSVVFGAKFFRMVVKAKQFEYIIDGGRCVSNGTDLESITRTHDEYETW